MSQYSLSYAENLSQFTPFLPPPAGGLIYIEQVAKNECENALKIPLRIAVNHSDKKAVFYHPRCKQWSCPTCAAINAALWQYRAIHGVVTLGSKTGQNGENLDFVTLTPHERLSSAGTLAVWPKAWPKLRKRILYETGGFQFLAVPEAHKSGKMHMHMIVTAKLRKKWWKDNARQCGLGYQSDVKEVLNAGGVGGYVAKYLSKQLQNSNFPKGHRHVRTSQGWPKLPPLKEAEGWTFYTLDAKTPLNERTTFYQQSGYAVTLANHITAWDVISPE